jgi:hypothetical protein
MRYRDLRNWFFGNKLFSKSPFHEPDEQTLGESMGWTVEGAKALFTKQLTKFVLVLVRFPFLETR